MEFFKIYIILFLCFLLGFFIRGIAEKISIMLHMYLYNKKAWNIEKEYKETNNNEKKELKEILDKYK